MYAAEIEHAGRTGIRHYPNKRYFKELRKQRKLLGGMALTDLRAILHKLHGVTDELTRPKQLKPSYIDRASKKEVLEMILSVRYLHEFLDEILQSEREEGPHTL